MTIATRRLAASIVATAFLSSCSVGPDFVRPGAPTATDYVRGGIRSEAAANGASQRFLSGRDIPGEWWALFHSTALNRLIAEALRANPNLAAAQSALRQAHELTLAGQAAFFPTVQTSFSPSRNKTATGTLSPATASGNPYYSLYTAQVGVSYAPDVFGGTRRQVEALAATEENQRFEVEATYLTLTANIVAAVIQEASLRGQIAATEEIIKSEREGLAILRRQLTLGQAAGADVAAQEAALAQAEATLPPLQKALGLGRDLLAVLIGRTPSDEPADRFDLASLQLPQDVPISLPSKLVEQRPDIRAAEAQLHAASADIGVATAAMLPQVSLTANLGSAAASMNGLFGPGTAFWSVMGNATQTIFDGGALLHKKRAAEAGFDQAAAQYRATVQAAFQNVADSLRALEADADALTANAAAERAAGNSLDIAKRQLALGAINYLALLNAQQTYNQALLNLAQAKANRFADTAALFQALGGGWWNRRDLAGE